MSLRSLIYRNHTLFFSFSCIPLSKLSPPSGRLLPPSLKPRPHFFLVKGEIFLERILHFCAPLDTQKCAELSCSLCSSPSPYYSSPPRPPIRSLWRWADYRWVSGGTVYGTRFSWWDPNIFHNFSKFSESSQDADSCKILGVLLLFSCFFSKLKV